MATQPLQGLPNLGSTIVRRLNEAGITTKEEWERAGAASTYRRLCELNPGKTMSVCYYLYSLEGALRGVHWNDLPAPVKQRLLNEVGRASSRVPHAQAPKE